MQGDIVLLIPALRGFAVTLTKSATEADDLVQETLLKALDNMGQFVPGTNLRAWLFTIQRNLHVSALRQGKRRGAHVDLDEATTPSSAAQQESGIEVQDILAALDQLPEEQKSLLLLVGVEDLSYEDAAKVMGVPAGTVMSRLSRGRQRLRTLLETGRTTLLRRVK